MLNFDLTNRNSFKISITAINQLNWFDQFQQRFYCLENWVVKHKWDLFVEGGHSFVQSKKLCQKSFSPQVTASSCQTNSFSFIYIAK